MYQTFLDRIGCLSWKTPKKKLKSASSFFFSDAIFFLFFFFYESSCLVYMQCKFTCCYWTDWRSKQGMSKSNVTQHFILSHTDLLKLFHTEHLLGEWQNKISIHPTGKDLREQRVKNIRDTSTNTHSSDYVYKYAYVYTGACTHLFHQFLDHAGW